ncbi:CPBP family intramembrane glutamic endopeptidase [Dactylosporangium sucinum]|uniref:CPBP family intramembrane glutamic endopeptidase n=1 Tax=Dactylosporangium sucinum TaxID=1424081 RepID=UPI001E34F9BF|nr:CPBP family intramembrane glutamic endopeptidase [Dactylosporangium sucinum]
MAIVVGVPAVAIVATLPLPGAWADVRPPTLMVLAAYLPVLLMQVLTSGLAEEPGWRDFAQPRLQDRFGPLTGSLILGPLWGAWHLPLFFSDWAGWPDVRWSMAVEFVASSVLLSIVLTWVFNRTGQSLPAAMVLHASVNTVFSLLWPAMFPSLDVFGDSLHAMMIGAGVTAVVLLVGTRGRLGHRGSRAAVAEGAAEKAAAGGEGAPAEGREGVPAAGAQGGVAGVARFRDSLDPAGE